VQIHGRPGPAGPARDRWNPDPTPDTKHPDVWSLLWHGFTGSLGTALFRFLPSWLVSWEAPYPLNLEPPLFPSLGPRDVAPAGASTGLAL